MDKKDIQFTVTLRSDGIVNVEGPLENKIFCLGLLELAKDAVYKYRPVEVPVDLLKSLGPNGNGK